MSRLLAILAAALLSLAVAPSVHAAPHKDQSTMQNVGDSAHGSSWDGWFGGPNHYMYASWDEGNQQPVGSGNAVWSQITLRIDTNNLPDTAAGHSTCVQVAVDWRVPQNASHYDARILRNCDPNSSATWTFSEKSTDNDPADCVIGTPAIVTVPCSSPMGRVQFARYDDWFGDVIGPIDCRTMAGVELHDCTAWEPWGNRDVTRIKMRSLDGSSTVYGSLDATSPNR